MFFLIVYELRNREKNYSTFYDSIKNLGSEACQCMTNVWLIYTDKEGMDLYNKLKPLIEDTDSILIAKTQYSDLAGWISSEAIDFLKRHTK